MHNSGTHPQSHFAWIRAARRLATLLIFALSGCAGNLTVAPVRWPTASEGAADEAFLDELQRRGLDYFLEQADPMTGLVADRAKADGGISHVPASIAATGFGITSLCIAEHRGWITRDEAYGRVFRTLSFLRDRLPNEHGFYFHFVDRRTGARQWNCELSSIDTALLMAGVLTAQQHFGGTDVERLARDIYERVDWPWMLAGGRTLSMGWTPEHGFLESRWDRFSEHPILYLLGLGSPTHPLPTECWDAWARAPIVNYAGRTFMQHPPLFVHQYPHAWIDFRSKRDAYADYWRNSVDATLAHRQFCIDLAKSSGQLAHYSPLLWGITSSDSAHGYVAWGGPPATDSPPIDGTVVPCAAAGSLPFAPKECLQTLQYMKRSQGARIWKRYGFVDAFNPATGWTASDVIGIDVGISLLMAENLRTGWVWECFGHGACISHALALACFHNASSGPLRRNSEDHFSRSERHPGDESIAPHSRQRLGVAWSP